MSFDYQPVLPGQLVSLRPLRPADLDELYTVAADPLLWEQHPAQNRHDRAMFGPFSAPRRRSVRSAPGLGRTTRAMTVTEGLNNPILGGTRSVAVRRSGYEGLSER